MLCSVTFSAVSKAAAITGSAEFFAPLIATVPRSAFPPLIRNLSIHSLFVLPWFLYVGSRFSAAFFHFLLCVLGVLRELCVKSFSSIP
jgi:hypothetical protein